MTEPGLFKNLYIRYQILDYFWIAADMICKKKTLSHQTLIRPELKNLHSNTNFTNLDREVALLVAN